MDKNKSISKICKDLLLREPYYGLFLIMTDKVWTEKVPTAGVARSGISYKLYINENFWESLSEKHKLGLTKHEMLHLAFFHPMMGDLFSDKDVFNIAADIEINQYISEDELPEGGVTLKTFPELNLPVKAGTRAYYDLLLQAQKDNTSPLLNKLLESMKSNKAEIYVDDTLVPNHDTWEEYNDLSDSEKKLIKNQVKYNIEKLAEEIKKGRGTVPSEIEQILKSFENLEPPKFDWRGYLRRFVGNSNKVYTKKLRRKFNKRFEDNPGLKIKKRQHILLAIDTSGSVSNEELQEFFSEINHIQRTGVDITLVQCDAAISNIGSYKPGADIKIYGRGGTSFEPVIEYYNANQRIYTSLIYFTDGEAPAPEKPKGRILWVLSERSKLNEQLPGQVIKLN